MIFGLKAQRREEGIISWKKLGSFFLWIGVKNREKLRDRSKNSE